MIDFGPEPSSIRHGQATPGRRRPARTRLSRAKAGFCSGRNPSVPCSGRPPRSSPSATAGVRSPKSRHRSRNGTAPNVDVVSADVAGFLRDLAAGEAGPPASRDGPTGLLAELTHRCPLHCEYCSNPVDPPTARGELDQADWSRVMAEAAALGVLQVHFSGGEPLLRPDLPDLIASARSSGLYTNLITSGLGLNRARAARLRAAGLDHAQISFQADEPALADAIAGVDLAPAQARRGPGRRRGRHRADDQRRSPPRQPRPPSRDHRPGRIARRRPGSSWLMPSTTAGPGGTGPGSSRPATRSRRRRRSSRRRPAGSGGGSRSSMSSPTISATVPSLA